MNWFKDKTFRILFFIGIVLILCGPFVLFLEWKNLGIFMGMAGGGVIGLAIALKIVFRPQTACLPHENNLKRKAWKDLGMYFYSLIAGGLGFYLLIQKDGHISLFSTLTARIIALSAVIIVGIWVAVGQFVMKERNLKGFDERERLIYEKAKMISDAIGGLFLTGLLGLPVWFGLNTSIPIFVPVLMFFALGFIAEIARPLIILIQCKIEQSEGGPA
ncbi:MAG: hypothetical protein ACYTFX_04935 [Planctomycetota bacterium]|jgi:hypothetical protein